LFLANKDQMPCNLYLIEFSVQSILYHPFFLYPITLIYDQQPRIKMKSRLIINYKS
jgi:hypothetical protein